MIIGASATMGTACEMMAQGTNDISSTRDFTTKTAPKMPTEVPRRKPQKVDCRVIQP